MEGIGDDSIDVNVKDTSFVQFLFDDTRLVSNTHLKSMEDIRANPENFLVNLHNSGIAYAILQRMNKFENWVRKHQEKQIERGNKNK